MNIDTETTLYVCWSKKEDALLYYSPRKSDGGVLAQFFEQVEISATCDGVSRTLAKELEARGYDLKTLKFSVKRKVEG